MTSNTGRGGRRTAPYVFTEQGVAMLSSVLNSPRAIVVNIEIMRTFVRVRELAATHGDLAARLNELEEKTEARGDPGSWLMNRFKHWKRHPCSEWFALIAANVRPVKSSTSQHEFPQYEHHEPQEYKDVSDKEPEFKVTRPGRLAFYPNDAIMPLLGDFYYSNNSGQIWVQIERCGTACTGDRTDVKRPPRDDKQVLCR